MSPALPLSAITYLWIGLAIVWLITGFRLKQVQEWQSPLPRALHMLSIALAFALVFYYMPALGWLNTRIMPHSLATAWTGLAITFAGIALATWARLILGGNWSGSITLKQDHALIRTGPYRSVRHPIYSGLILAMLGTAIAIGEIRGFCAAAVMLIAFLIKARSEDNLMHRTFGAEHDAYRATTGVLLPRLR